MGCTLREDLIANLQNYLRSFSLAAAGVHPLAGGRFRERKCTPTLRRSKLTCIITSAFLSLVSFPPALNCPSFLADNTAGIVTKRGGFRRRLQEIFLLPVVIEDNGYPPKSSTGTLTIRVCGCETDGSLLTCSAEAIFLPVGLSTGALVAILLCIVILLGESSQRNLDQQNPFRITSRLHLVKRRVPPGSVKTSGTAGSTALLSGSHVLQQLRSSCSSPSVLFFSQTAVI